MRVGDTLDQWQRGKLLSAQRHRCFICRKPFSASRRPQLDHDHMTGLIRGYLCFRCNNAIGLNHDDAEWFTRAGSYLAAPIAADVLGCIYVAGSPGAEGLLNGC